MSRYKPCRICCPRCLGKYKRDEITIFRGLGHHVCRCDVCHHIDDLLAFTSVKLYMSEKDRFLKQDTIDLLEIEEGS